MTDRPHVRRASKPLRFTLVVWDYRHGEKFQREATMEIVAEEWLNRKTNRYRRVYAAREVGNLGWHGGRDPRKAILNAALSPVNKRDPAIAEACRQAKALVFRPAP